MKIEKLKKTTKGKYKVYLDNNEVITTYDEVILKNNLLYKKNIDANLLNELEKDNDYYELYNKCVNLISKKLRSEKEVREYLSKYTNEDINNIINKLKEIGLINDIAFAKAFIMDKINFSNVGPLKIENLLLDHNIDSSIIKVELDNIDKELINNKLEKYIQKKIKNNTKYSSYMLKTKILNELINNGFYKEDIINILDKYSIESNIDKEVSKQYKKLSLKYNGYELLMKLKTKLYQKGYTKEEIDEILQKYQL